MKAGLQNVPAGAGLVLQVLNVRRSTVTVSLQRRVAATHLRESRKRKSLVRR